MIPAAFIRLESLPLTVNGKLDRKLLPAPEKDAYLTSDADFRHFVEKESVAPAAKAPLSRSERDIQRIWQKIFNLEDLDVESDFFSLGAHSLLLARLQIFMNREFNVQLTTADIFRNPTIKQLAAWLDLQRSAAQQAKIPVSIAPPVHNPRVVPIQPSGAGRPIFVISQSMIFRTLAAELGAGQPVYSIQMLDQDTLAMGSGSFDRLIDFYVRLIREVQPQGPYRIAGWCVSGWIAYGVARQLEKEGAAIELLIVIDSWAPGYWADQPPIRKRLMVAIYEMQRSRWIGRHLRQSAASAAGKPHRLRLENLAGALRKMATRIRRGRAPVDVDETEEMRRLAALQRTAKRAGLTGPLLGNIVLFRSEEEPTGPLLASDMGWGVVVGRPVVVERLPGDHHQIFGLPGARRMALSVLERLGVPAPHSAVATVPAPTQPSARTVSSVA